MRIAVIADTHDWLPPGLVGRIRDADEIWHLGDVCDPSTLVELELTGRPLHVILGNNDTHPGWPLELVMDRERVRFHLVHIPPRRAPRGAKFVLHGHTHVPRDEVDPTGVRWLNPGCITHATRGAPPSFAWLDVVAGEVRRWRIVPV